MASVQSLADMQRLLVRLTNQLNELDTVIAMPAHEIVAARRTLPCCVTLIYIHMLSAQRYMHTYYGYRQYEVSYKPLPLCVIQPRATTLSITGCSKTRSRRLQRSMT